MELKEWSLTINEHVATLTFCRASEQNSISAEALAELEQISQELQTNQDVWVIVLKADGKHFSIGVDVNLIRMMSESDRSVYRDNLRRAQICIDAFDAIQKPIIARIHGFCFGGGMILASCCDFRISSSRAIYCMPEVKRSIGVIMGTSRITRLVGVGNAKEMMMLGDRFNAKRAAAYGFVNEVVEPDQLDDAVDRLAKKLLALPARAVRLNKQIIDYEYDAYCRRHQDFEIHAQQGLLDTHDFKEAMDSYFEGRPAKYRGK